VDSRISERLPPLIKEGWGGFLKYFKSPIPPFSKGETNAMVK
jgi:hypothetical protein